MTKAKRFLSVLLSLCLVLGMLPSTVFATSSSIPFTDVNATDWHYEAVQYVYDKGMMSGTSTTTFAPNDTTTRGMIATVLHRMEGTPSAAGATFADVPAGQWYFNAVAWTSANGIMDGYGNGVFGPDDAITREQMATILHRYSQYKGYNISASGSVVNFSDASQVSSYAVDSMNWAIGNGLISGVGNNTLDPKGNATRAQIATILMRYCANVVPTDNTDNAPASDTTVDTTYTVAFDLNYGNNTQYEVKTVKAGETVEKPSNPSRNGYSFRGWYTEKSNGSQFDFKKEITADLTLYAHWSAKSNGGEYGNNSSSGSPTPPEANSPETTTSGEITYKAPTESDIDSGIIEYDGQTYTAKYVNNQLVVVFKDGTNDNTAEEIIKAYDASIVGEIETIGIYQIEFNSAKTLDELNSLATAIKSNVAVEDAYLNTVIECEDTTTQYYPTDTWDNPDDPNYPRWDELNPYGHNWGAEAINAPSAWQLLIDKYGSISSVPSVRVGVIDSYIDMTHEDLKENVYGVYSYQTDSNIFKKNQTKTTAAEYATSADNWDDYDHIIHGTHVMGTIGATVDNNGIGINGIALNPELYGVSIAEARGSIVYTRFGLSTALSNLIEDSKCKVINFSQGYKYTDYNPTKAMDDGKKVGQELKKYLDKNYDFLIVATAGNKEDDEEYRDAQYASFFNAISDATVKSHIIVVGNAQNYGGKPFSLYEGQCYGSRVDVIAPGTNIYSTVSPNPRSFLEDGAVKYKANSKYIEKTGTSMAAPHVSGVATLIWAANPTLKGNLVKDILVETANIPVDGNLLKENLIRDANILVDEVDRVVCSRMINAAYAVSTALGIKYIVNGTCGNNITWTLDTAGNLIIQGTGEMTWTPDYAPWYRYREIIKYVKIEDGITSIYDGAFKECSKVNAVDLGNNIRSIGEYAFGDMTNLHSIEIPNSVQKIGDLAFGYDNGTPISGFTIYGYSGTVAETYAHDNGFIFIDLTSQNPDKPTDGPAISGSVRDASTGLVLEGVDVYVYDEDGFGPFFTGKTGSDGAFYIELKENGIYNLKFFKEGYEDYDFNKLSVTGETLIGAISLTSIGGVKFAGGDGTQGNPYQIKTAEQLNAIRNDVTGHYKLIADIDLSVYPNWEPISTFTGSLNGNGYVIKNLSIKSIKTTYVGLFGQVDTGKLENIILENVDIDFQYDSEYNMVYCGALVGSYSAISNLGSIANCYTSGKITISVPDGYLYVGGLVGSLHSVNQFVVSNCHNQCDISSNIGNIGGIIGYARGEYSYSCSVTVENCSNSGELTGSVCGGIVGRGEDFLFSSTQLIFNQCFNSGKISGDRSGGIVGYFYYTSYGSHVFYLIITDSYNCGAVTGESTAGGIAGYSRGTYATIQNCYSIGYVSAQSCPAGILGLVSGTRNITNCYYANADKGDWPSGDAEESSVKLSLTDFQNEDCLVGFDFENTWTYSGDYLYPQLRDNMQ